jgi:hypothetical protein
MSRSAEITLAQETSIKVARFDDAEQSGLSVSVEHSTNVNPDAGT